MGALPKRKPSTRRQGKRRATQQLKVPEIAICPECKSDKLPHYVCPSCGSYGKKESDKKQGQKALEKKKSS
jgi:large subunit ribosomal protein L32